MKGIRIEKESFDIIEQNVDLSQFSTEEKLIVKRIIHASGDFEYANLVKFSKNSIKKAKQAIKNRWDIICDVNMVKAGITEEFARKCSLNLHCFIKDDRIIKWAKEANKTRAESAVEYVNSRFDKAIFVIGNAPTALLKIIELHQKKLLIDSLVLAFPVGFVDAAYSKELLMGSELDYITNMGTKGGSSIAASAVRALMKLSCSDL
jgi:precorrin-8X/cobalt-precorrin-8 methylmutase